MKGCIITPRGQDRMKKNLIFFANNQTSGFTKLMHCMIKRISKKSYSKVVLRKLKVCP